ncbi:N-terminal Xaa-Pro-Lys N-methyltransferase 1 [Bombyx mori]|uniref:N-terminal Xaa-Pro-Lys N-methyltransferase 1 n=1 Tax=Bombyx mori TaxID=7091 RepID=UPI00035034F0
MTEKDFYKKAAIYWANVPATIDGVLGGFGNFSDIDIDGSRAFLNKVLSSANPPATKLALDCGAGIGRVTKHLLIHYFEKIDLVEPDLKFITEAKINIGDDVTKLGTLYQTGLQNFRPHKNYDVIWCQWVLGHLNDSDLIKFLSRSKEALSKNGLIIIKENITTSKEVEYDEDDSSMTRPLELMTKIFDQVNLRIIHSDIQYGFPEDIYPIHCFALSPVQ